MLYFFTYIYILFQDCIYGIYSWFRFIFPKEPPANIVPFPDTDFMDIEPPMEFYTHTMDGRPEYNFTNEDRAAYWRTEQIINNKIKEHLEKEFIGKDEMML